MTSSRHEPVPELVLAQRSRDERVLPSEAGGDVRLWDGNVGAIFGYEASGANWIHVEGIGTFRFLSGGLQVDAFPADDVSAAVLRDVYERSVLPLVLQSAGRQVLHASAVHDGEGVMALAGSSRSGKSTIAVALAEHGYSVWADDAVAFAVRSSRATAIPLPFSSRLRPSAAAQLSPPTTTRHTRPEALTAIVLLTQVEPASGTLQLTRVRGADAFSALLPHAYCFTLQDHTQTRTLSEDYMKLADVVPLWRLSFTPGLEHLADMIMLLEASALSK